MKLPRVNFLLLRNIILFSIVSSVIFTAGYYFGFQGYKFETETYPKVTIERLAPPDKREISFGLFWNVWDSIHQNYLRKELIKDSKLIYGAVKGMVAAIGDPYTVYLPPEENKVIQEDLGGSFEGVGIQIGFVGNQLAVIAPLSGSPAEKAGIKPGDYIIGIIDKVKNVEVGTVGMTSQEAVKLIRGDKGTNVTLVILREENDLPVEIEIVRDSIDVPSVVVEYIDGKDGKTVAHLKLTRFAGETIEEWETAVVEILTKENMGGMVLDMRNNPGGYLDDSIVLASDFLEIGNTVVRQEKSDGTKNSFDVENLGRLRDMPLVVLVNSGSASASEILAGALKDHKRAKIVGTKTFGKGTIQESMQLDNGNGGLHITVAKWLTPDGFWVNEVGLTPDFEVENDPENDIDEQLEKALEVLVENKN